jgi:hypothetical protein
VISSPVFDLTDVPTAAPHRSPVLGCALRLPCPRCSSGPLFRGLAQTHDACSHCGLSLSVRITLIDREVPSYFQSLEHLLRYSARTPFALERLSVVRGEDGRIARVRYVLPRRWVILWAANWVGPGRGRKSTRPGANGVVELSPFDFLGRLADLVPPPRKHRHRYHGVFAPNHKLRSADMRRPKMPPATAATHTTNRALTTPRGLPVEPPVSLSRPWPADRLRRTRANR